ncbi:MAG: PIN domain-containing protein, partial [Bacteroidota bacterium]
VLDVSELDIRNAAYGDFKDFEDAIQHSVAERHESISAIITRNSKDYKKSVLPIFSPNVFLKSFHF